MYGLSERLVERKREARGCNQKSTILVGVPQLLAGLSSVQPPQTEQHGVEMPLGVLAALTGSAANSTPFEMGIGDLKKKKKGKRKKQKPTILITSLTTFKRSCSW